MVRTRFAPSPTGFLHIGGLRTALFAYLFAKRNGGAFLLRIEDTDQERFVEGSLTNIIDSLKWAGMSIDEGVDTEENGKVVQKGDKGPYIQSERLPIYKKYIQELIAKDAAYYCFCDKERLDALRQEQEANKQATGYDGHCRSLDSETVQKQLAENVNHVIRLKVPHTGVTRFKDLIRGEVEFKNELIDDQVLLKSDGFPTYHFAVVVDDHLMEITHVVRGEEWLPSTPKHVLLYELFGWKSPEFVHLSLLVNENRQKLSKRHGDVSVRDFKESGYMPEALVNFIAFLGWNPGDEREIFSLSELTTEFTFEKVTKAPAVFNREKLAWFNKQYLTQLSLQEVAERSIEFFHNSGLLDNGRSTAEVVSELMPVVELERSRVTTLKELPEAVGFIFAKTLDYDADLLIWKKSTREESKEKLEMLYRFLDTLSPEEWNKEVLELKLRAWMEENSFGTGDVLWPMRVSLSGLKNSPGPFEIATVLGKKATLERIQKASLLL